MAGRRVLITGVGSYLGTLLAARLEEDPSFERIVGLDTRAPRRQLGRTELIEADIRDPSIAPLIAGAEVDTVVHNSIVRQPGPGMSARAMHDINVIGSLQLLSACGQLGGGLPSRAGQIVGRDRHDDPVQRSFGPPDRQRMQERAPA